MRRAAVGGEVQYAVETLGAARRHSLGSKPHLGQLGLSTHAIGGLYVEIVTEFTKRLGQRNAELADLFGECPPDQVAAPRHFRRVVGRVQGLKFEYRCDRVGNRECDP